jgi:CheY-like chemotaxis protein
VDGGTEHFQDANGNAGARRKGKFGRRPPAGFVGPMDHSYRTVNGNIADGPPSTMDYRSSNGNGNGNMSSRNDYAEPEQPQTPRADAPVRIVCFIEDLFIVTKMNETARKMGVKIQFAKAEKETLAVITDGPEADRPALIIFDLNNANAKPLTLIPKLKAKLKRSTSIIGFLQHVQGDLKMKAVEAGCDTVIPRSAFSLSLPNLLRRYGLTEEEELAEA